jgi:hypothetical protein
VASPELGEDQRAEDSAISPPMWPPIEIPEIVKLMDQVDQPRRERQPRDVAPLPLS